ncbi:DUF2267 domain-containing protein [Lyngbya sp. CCY1209]|uniref:DUF2267 domain-containing protein n=1 Tax=Lyngbya sp. CCY1209 TaxID=2886103 RepID=UPI002D2066E6|nr:DUF2267 domain-containing protein [Lyngbya sp. CCY1209]MEB3883539.1 DUF2267 domain-containing protein [Lyngbya sp. CCY1209]
MPIAILDDIVYTILQKIDETDKNGKHPVNFVQSDFSGRTPNQADRLGHLDYLNQNHYIEADFSGNAYAKQEDVPNLVNPDEIDIRIANTLGASDGPLPHLIDLERAKLTEKGAKMLEEMNMNPPQMPQSQSQENIAPENLQFLEKIKVKGQLEDIYDARDVTEVVFRTMRDMMTTESADRVASELHEESVQAKDKSLQNEISDLWQDTNPLVAWLSRLRPPLKIDEKNFIFRIEQEGGIPRSTDAETVIKAVFSATKDELSQERISEISGYLPGRVKEMWDVA